MQLLQISQIAVVEFFDKRRMMMVESGKTNQKSKDLEKVKNVLLAMKICLKRKIRDMGVKNDGKKI